MNSACSIPRRWITGELSSARCCALSLGLLALATVSAAQESGKRSHDASSPARDDQIEETPLTESDREHWSFQPIRRVPTPQLESREDLNSPIDAFIQRRLDVAELEAVPRAKRQTLIRRLTIDLTGLPPAPDDVQRFVSDTRPDATARLVDRLLASPRYGERYAQYWLDLARFAETDGFEHDKIRKDAWKFRDWVVDSLNSDDGYDRFVTLQLAGDELAPEDEEAVLATAFCLAGPDMPDINSQEERRHYLLNGMTSTLGSVVMGLQLECAQCHDHKFDPISQADFYRLRSAFEPAVSVKKNESVSVLSERGGEPERSRLRIRGDWHRLGPEIEPAFLRIANRTDTNLVSLAESLELETSGRRLALSQWLFAPEHPLTSRVIANRLWQYHFGQGLCRSSSDFGYMGDSPTHPQLLDWLASEMMRVDWSSKALHRKMVLSAVYQRSGHPAGAQPSDKGNAAIDAQFLQLIDDDPRNRLLARFPRRRLQGEVLRDSMLFVAGSLDSRMGGPGIRPPLPKELQSELLKGQWQVTEDVSQHRRRSIYIFARRNLRLPIFDAFDRPDANQSCARRYESTTALQSLQLLNSSFSHEIAELLAERLVEELPDDNARIAQLFQLTLGRAPFDSERAAFHDYLDPANKDSWVDLCLVVLNANEFMYVD